MWGLKLSLFGRGRGLVSWATPICSSEDDGDYRLFLRLMRPNCLAPSHLVLSEPGLESFSKESNEVGLSWGPVSIKLDKDGLERR